MIIDCISDLHGHYPELEGGDLLIVAGDLTARDTSVEHIKFQIWLHDQNYSKKIVIAGNHDNRLQDLGFASVERQYAELGEDYLCDSGTEFVLYPPLEMMEEGKVYERPKVKIWGSPWTGRFEGMNPHAMAFTCETEEELAEKWALIPSDIDILVTHSPSYGVLDEVRRFGPFSHERDESVGSESLIKPMIKSGCKLHVFGHIHEGYGVFKNNINGITYVNASHVNERYEPVNKPIRIEL